MAPPRKELYQIDDGMEYDRATAVPGLSELLKPYSHRFNLELVCIINKGS
ncbi:MAG: hypothetical protein AB9903_35615 [Vulcanimicrobiota bacterium]